MSLRRIVGLNSRALSHACCRSKLPQKDSIDKGVI